MFCRRCCRGLQKWDITSNELNTKIQQGAIVLDVRSPQEYREEHIPGSINIPEYEIRERVFKEIPKLNQLIVTYCEYGGRSRNVCYELRRMGYSNVFNLYGGLNEM